MIGRDVESAMRWIPTQYAAGHRARLNAHPNSALASHSWQCGWDEADTEALESARHMLALAQDGADAYPETWNLLFEGGGNARINGIAFEEGMTQPWKEGWIAADIDLGTIRTSKGRLAGTTSSVGFPGLTS